MSTNFSKPLAIIAAVLLTITACKKKVETEVIEVPTAPGLPSVLTLTADSVSSDAVVLSGQVTREGNGEIAVVGFCWSDQKTPIVDQTPTNQQMPDNRFRYRLTGLKPGTLYNFRAYATNSKGIGYGEVVSFQTKEGWKKVETPANTINRQFSEIISTGTKLVGIYFNTVYVSSDNGLTWTSSVTGLMGSVYRIVNSGETLFAVTSNGIFVSNNSGGIWFAANNGLGSNINVTALHHSANTMFAASSYSVFRSTNNGQSWIPLNNLANLNSVVGITSQANSLFVRADNYTYQSDDGGQNWAMVPNNQSLYINTITATNSALLALANQRLYVSTDKAKNWTQISVPHYLTEIITSENKALAFGNSGNAPYLSFDGGKTWILNSGGLDGVSVYSFVFHKDYILANTSNGFYKLMVN